MPQYPTSNRRLYPAQHPRELTRNTFANEVAQFLRYLPLDTHSPFAYARFLLQPYRLDGILLLERREKRD